MSIRWIVIFIALELLSIVAGKSLFDTSSEHRKRHKRVIKLPFVAENLSHNPEVRRVLLSCPRQNDLEPKKYLEFHELCDDIQDCPNGEDEDEHFCMFKKLEDAEIQRLKSNIRSVIRQRSRKPRPHYQFVHTHHEKQAGEEEEKSDEDIEQKEIAPVKPLKQQKIVPSDNEDSYEDESEESEDEESEDKGAVEEKYNNDNNPSRVSDAFRVQSSKRKS